MGSILIERKTNGKIRYRAEVRKERRRITKRFPNKSLAKKWIAHIEAKIVEGTFFPEFKKHSFKEAVERYTLEVLPYKKKDTKSLHLSQLRWFQKHIGDLKLYQIDSALLAKLREELKSEDVKKTEKSVAYKRSSSTVNRYFVPFSHCLNIAKREWGWLRDVPQLAKLKEPKGRTRFLTPNQAQQILTELLSKKQRDVYLACKISLTFGSRLNETCALCWDDIDWDNKVITFRETKNGLVKGLPIPNVLLLELKEWRQSSEHASVFLFPTEQKSKRGHIYDKAKKGFLKACNKLEIKGVTYHCTRHTVASWATQAGINRKTIAEVLGHQDLRTTDRYSHLEIDHLRSTVELIENLLSEPQVQSFDA